MYSKSSTTTKLYFFGDVFMRVCIILSVVLSNLAMQTTMVSADTGEEISQNVKIDNPDLTNVDSWIELSSTTDDLQLSTSLLENNVKSENNVDTIEANAKHERLDFMDTAQRYISQNQASGDNGLVNKSFENTANIQDEMAYIDYATPNQYIDNLKITNAQSNSSEYIMGEQFPEKLFYKNNTVDISSYPECTIDSYNNGEEDVVEIVVDEGETCRLVPGDYMLTNLSVSGTLYFETANYYDETSGNYYSDYVHIITDAAEVTESGHISADGQGYASGEGPGAPEDGDETTTPGGAGYGGYGGYGDLQGGTPYTGNMIAPGNTILLTGSGGGGPDGGAGGGIVDITATGSLINNGKITANGKDGSNYSSVLYSGGGAGGSVYLYTPNITGDGVISANGGNSADNCSTTICGGGGAGGRIIVADFNNTYAGTIEAFGGEGLNSQYAGAGTIFKKFNTFDYANRLFVDNNGNDGLDTMIKPDVVKVAYIMETYINGSGHLVVERTNEAGIEEACEFIGPWTVFGDGSGSLITKCDIETPSYEFMEVNGYDLFIMGDTSEIYDLTITDGDVILFTPPEGNAQTFRDIKIEPGNMMYLFSNEVDGEYTINANSINIASESSIQSKSGDYTIGYNVADELTVDGLLAANGYSGVDGATLQISATTLSGDGTIQANGGDGEYFGDGGNIALHYNSLFFTGLIQAYGGEYGEYAGNPGLITYNTSDKLVVDNRDNAGTLTIPEGVYSFNRIELGNAIELIFAGENAELTINDGVYSIDGEEYPNIPILTIEGLLIYTVDFVVDNVILNWLGQSDFQYSVNISESEVQRNGYSESDITLNLTDNEGTPISRDDVYIRVSGDGNELDGVSPSVTIIVKPLPTII